MKRHPALQDLSRDHHLLLLQARQIRWLVTEDHRAPSLNIVVADFLHIWEETGVPHLREEEAVLLPFYARFPSAEQREHECRALDEHEWLREKIAALHHADANQQALMGEISVVLHGHIRFEERVVFQRMQAILPESAMLDLQEQLAAFRALGREGPDDMDDRSH